MNSLVTFAISYLVNSVWQGSLVAGMGWLASRVVRRLGPGAEHVTWVATLGLALVTPALPFAGWSPEWFESTGATAGKIAMTMSAAPSEGARASGVCMVPTAVVWGLLLVYGCVLLMFAVRLARSMRSTALLLRGARAIELSEERERMVRQCERWFGLTNVRVLSASRVVGPVTLGFRRPVLLVTKSFAEGCAAEDFLAALAHECAHMRRGDFWKNLVYETASLVLAFHPAVWMMKAKVAQTREMVCDEMATDRLVETRAYAQSLLRLATMMAVSAQASAAHAIGIFDANILEKRIMRMSMSKRQVGFAVWFGLVNAAMLCLLSATVGGAVLARVIEPGTHADAAASAGPAGNEQSSAKGYGPLYKVGNNVSAPTPLATPLAKFPPGTKGAKGPMSALVLVGVVVDEAGMPRDVHIVKSYREDFDASAMDAVRGYRFKPAMREGKAVAVRVNIEVNFRKY